MTHEDFDNFLQGREQLITEGEMWQHYNELNLRQDAEHNERFKDYTEQQYLKEQVYGC